ncbi:MAG: membrane dipeptidase [Archangium sp.]
MLMSLSLLLLAQIDPSAAAVPLGGDYWQGTNVPAGEVWGVADLHAHYFNYLAFGGRVLHGTPWAPNGMRQALRKCRVHHGENDYGFSTAILPEPSHPTSGYPKFEGWPRWDTTVHQQAYVDWIRRAWQGGLRIVQMDVQSTPALGATYATANGLFVDGNRTPVPPDDAAQLELQVGAARQFFAEGGPAGDFAGIARTPAEARALIRKGKLAVILGIEVESLEAIGDRDAGVEQTVSSVIRELREAGVVHVIPIHLQRNGFGHPAVFNPTLNAMNFTDTGEFYATEDAFDAGIRFDPKFAAGSGLANAIGLVGGIQGKPAFAPGAQAIAAREGLSEKGRLLVRQMLRGGFLVDVQHMSMRAAEEALAIAEEEKVPVMTSHTSFADLAFGTKVTFRDGDFDAAPPSMPYRESPQSYGTSDSLKVVNEYARTRKQMARIKALGGIVGLPLAGKGIGVAWRDGVPLDCDQTSKSFAQALAYAEETMGADSSSIAIATDVGGFALLPAPRFGVEACPGSAGDELRGGDGKRRAQAAAQQDAVVYRTPTKSLGAWLIGRKDSPWTEVELREWIGAGKWAALKGPNAPLERSVAGKRDFDVNLDGMAHYGMMPDFFQDLSNVERAAGKPKAIAPLFRSAEGYLQMWERVERARR